MSSKVYIDTVLDRAYLDLRQENRVVAAQHSPEAPQEVQHHGSIGGHLAANSRLVAQGIPHRRVSEPLKVGHAGSDRKESALEHGRACTRTKALIANPQRYGTVH
jgi:hypothetical protein